jgi:hypothetical protein
VGSGVDKEKWVRGSSLSGVDESWRRVRVHRIVEVLNARRTADTADTGDAVGRKHWLETRRFKLPHRKPGGRWALRELSKKRKTLRGPARDSPH